MNRAALALWLAVAIAGAVTITCAQREEPAAQLTPEQIIESNPTGAGIVEARPGYFKKAAKQ